MGTTVITTAGVAAALAAGTGGPDIEITKAQIGNVLINPTPSFTAVGGTMVHETTNLRYQILDQNTIQYSFVLDESVGTFDIGNVGLFLADGTLFSITSYEAIQTKIHTIADTQQGNRITIRIQMRISGLTSITNLTILVADEAALPEVATQANLPSAGSAPFNAYLVRAHASYAGRAAIALRVAGAWQYCPADAGAGGALVETNGITLTGKFDASCDAGEIVYWDGVGLEFLPAEAYTAGKEPIGLRGSADILHMAGSIYTHGSNIYTGGTKYYASLITPGALTTVANDYPVGVAIANNMLLVTLGSIFEPIVGGGGYTPIGKKNTTYLPSTAWYPTKIVGNAPSMKWITPPDLNRGTYLVYDFPKSVLKVLETESYLVKSWNKNVNVEMYVKWLRPAVTGSNDVVWKVKATGIKEGVATNVTFSTMGSVIDSAASPDLFYTTDVINLDLSGFTPESGVHIQLYRDIDSPDDKMATSAYFHSATLKMQALLDTDA